jgi:hypothetical protein
MYFDCIFEVRIILNGLFPFNANPYPPYCLKLRVDETHDFR